MFKFFIVQARVLKKYPANLSVTAYSYLFGVILMVITSFFMTNESTDWNLTQSEFFAVLYGVSFHTTPFLEYLLQNICCLCKALQNSIPLKISRISFPLPSDIFWMMISICLWFSPSHLKRETALYSYDLSP